MAGRDDPRRLRKGSPVRIVRHTNERVAGKIGVVAELMRPSGLVPDHPGSAWVKIDGYPTEAFCRRDELEPI